MPDHFISFKRHRRAKPQTAGIGVWQQGIADYTLDAVVQQPDRKVQLSV